MDKVYSLLRNELEIPEPDCLEYINHLSELGYDCLDSIKLDLTANEMSNFMKTGHIKRLLRSIGNSTGSFALPSKLITPGSFNSYSEYESQFKQGGPLSLQILKISDRREPNKSIVYLGEQSAAPKPVDFINIPRTLDSPYQSPIHGANGRRYVTKESVILLGFIGKGSSSIVYKYLYVPTLRIIAVSIHLPSVSHLLQLLIYMLIHVYVYNVYID